MTSTGDQTLGLDPTGWTYLSDPVWVFDLARCRMVWGNRAALEFWHADSLEELCGRDMSDMSDAARNRLTEYAERFSHGESIDATWTLYPGDAMRSVRCRLAGVPLRDGTVAMLVNVVELLDEPGGEAENTHIVEELREARDGLARAEARYLAFVQAGSDWLWETDDHHRFVYVSPSIKRHLDFEMQRYLGKTRIEIAKEFGYDLDVEGSEQKWRAHEEDLAQHRSFRDFEYAFVRSDGEDCIVSISGDPVFDSNGRFTGYRGIGRDITRRVQAERYASEMQRERDVAVTANAMMNQFLATMSHELRTPLNAVIGFSEVMSEEMFGPLGSETYREYADSIHKSARHLLDVVSDLLNVSRLDGGEAALDIECFSADQFVLEIIQMTRPLVQGRAIRLEHDVSEATMEIVADRRGLRQVLLNLVSNAVKFTEEGGLIELLCIGLPDGATKIVVRDTGCGIEPVNLPDVFEPFRTFDPMVARASGGVGLGLWICRRIVAAHGGTIDLTSTPGIGTTVEVRLPGIIQENVDEQVA
ncbi:MAG: PAS domain-containing sensor histidine kinase [Alphaproteobacteria bacterium]|nr:PAS domain-containing sensor histidine kinase [Alphaproteobacteria bacterium]